MWASIAQVRRSRSAIHGSGGTRAAGRGTPLSRPGPWKIIRSPEGLPPTRTSSPVSYDFGRAGSAVA